MGMVFQRSAGSSSCSSRRQSCTVSTSPMATTTNVRRQSVQRFYRELVYSVSQFSKEQQNAVVLVILLNALTIVSSLFKVDASVAAALILLSPVQSVISVTKQVVYILLCCVVELVVLSCLWVLFLTSNSTSALIGSIRAKWARLRQVFRYAVTALLLYSIYLNWTFRIVFVSHISARAVIQVMFGGAAGRVTVSAPSAKKGVPRRVLQPTPLPASQRSSGSNNRRSSPMKSSTPLLAVPSLAGGATSPKTSERVKNVSLVNHSYNYRHREGGTGATPKTPALTKRLFADDSAPTSIGAEVAQSSLVDRLPTLFNVNNWFADAKSANGSEFHNNNNNISSSNNNDDNGIATDDTANVSFDHIGELSSSGDADVSMTIADVPSPSPAPVALVTVESRVRGRVTFAEPGVNPSSSGSRKKKRNTPFKQPSAAVDIADATYSSSSSIEAPINSRVVATSAVTAAANPPIQQPRPAVLFPFAAGALVTYTAVTTAAASKRKLQNSRCDNDGDDDDDDGEGDDDDIFENRKRNLNRIQNERNKIVESLIESTINKPVAYPPVKAPPATAAAAVIAASDPVFNFTEPKPSFTFGAGKPPMSPPKGLVPAPPITLTSAPGIAFSFPPVNSTSSSATASTTSSISFNFGAAPAADGGAFLFASGNSTRADKKKVRSKKK